MPDDTLKKIIADKLSSINKDLEVISEKLRGGDTTKGILQDLEEMIDRSEGVEREYYLTIKDSVETFSTHIEGVGNDLSGIEKRLEGGKMNPLDLSLMKMQWFDMEARIQD